MLTPGQTLHLTIDKPAAGGRMIARAEGQIVLVSGAIPGERAAVRIERLGRGVAYGEATAIDLPSPDRRSTSGDPLCGGCLYAHISYPRQLAIKGEVIADALGRIGKIPWADPIEVTASPEEGYRMRARLHVRRGRLGFFREGTHQVCDARGTGQLLPATSDILDALADTLSGGQLEGAELELSENVPASERALHLEVDVADDGLVASWGQLAGVTGLTVGRSAHPSSRGPRLIAGDPHVTDVLTIQEHPVRLRRHVMAFFQGNRHILADLVSHVVDAIEPRVNVVDLYAGAGVFSVAAAVVAEARVTAVEGDRISAADLKANAEPLAGGVEAVQQSVEEFTARARKAPDVLIVDPPRTGMSKAAVDGAIGLAARRVAYVSCDVATLARDARRFIDAGYQLRTIRGFDLFPNTPHVESVAIFTR